MPSRGRPLPPEPVRLVRLEETGVPGFALAGAGPEGLPRLAPLSVSNADRSALGRQAGGLALRAAVIAAGFGGGAAALDRTPDEDLLRRIGASVHALGGRYLLSQGFGLTTEEMTVIREETPHVIGIDSGDPSPLTALGVFATLRALAPRLKDYRVAVQGVGRVGSRVAVLLSEAGSVVLIADLDAERAARVADQVGGDVVPPDEVIGADCDVLTPNGRDVALDLEAVRSLRCRGVAGSCEVAADEEVAVALAERRILAVPERIAGSGWLLNLAAERRPGGYDGEAARAFVIEKIEGAVREVFRIASRECVTTARAADLLGERRLAGEG